MLGRLSERFTQILTGAITMVLISALVVFGVRAANGALEPRYQVMASFSAAGQGLLPQSDVKIHGVNIGEVKSVKLENGRALVRMDIDKAERIPRESLATIRPKTLFGEKFVDIDPGDTEMSGPFLGDEERITKTLGGFELEKLLTEAYPILQAVDPEDLATILSELAASGKDLGPVVNRTISNFAAVADVQARHAADMRQFLEDLALLSDELAKRGEDLVGVAREANVALPELNARDDELAVLLEQTARLSTDLADLLEANKPTIEKGITQGSKALQTIYDRRDPQLPGLVRGLRTFFEVLASVGRIELGDGTRMAAVKGILGGGPACGRTDSCVEYSGPPAGSSGRAAASGPTPPAVDPEAQRLSELLSGLNVPAPVTGPASVVSLVEGLVR